MIEHNTTTLDNERAVLVGLITTAQPEPKAMEYISELAFLAETAGAVTVKTFSSVPNTQIPVLLWERESSRKSGLS